MKTSLLATLSVLIALQRQPPQLEPRQDAEHCSCSIEVIVKRAATGDPIPDVELQLRSASATDIPQGTTIGQLLQGGGYVRVFRGGPFSVKTSASGRAEFRDLAEGEYTVVAQRLGNFYFTGRPNQAQSTVYVGPLERRIQQVSFTMMTGGSISGRVLNSNHQPVPTVVSAYQVEYHNGQRSLVAAGSAEETNELGEYKLLELTAGEYYIRTVSSS
ncbi:MAG TPA: hypothetical protein VK210_06870, partial [Terriglobia bacterium]|nr:hypothetical protein [Terriglobia bacterium]